MSARGADPSERFVWPPGPPAPPKPNAPQSLAPFEPPHWLDASWPREATRFGRTIGELERVLLGGGTCSLEARAAQLVWRPEPAGRACWRCAESVGEHEVDDTGCATCRGSRPPWNRFVRLGAYDGLVRSAILELKFRARRGVGGELGRLLGLRLNAELQAQGHEPGAGVVVPVPISTRRRLQRGVDHTAVLAGGVSSRSGLTVTPLLRRSHRPSQLSVPTSQREANVRGSIGVRRGRRAPEEGVVVVLDDVRTTGATMRAACRCVQALGVDRGRIWACVAGVGDGADRQGRAGVDGISSAQAGLEDGAGGKDRQSFSGED